MVLKSSAELLLCLSPFFLSVPITQLLWMAHHHSTLWYFSEFLALADNFKVHLFSRAFWEFTHANFSEMKQELKPFSHPYAWTSAILWTAKVSAYSSIEYATSWICRPGLNQGNSRECLNVTHQMKVSFDISDERYPSSWNETLLNYLPLSVLSSCSQQAQNSSICFQILSGCSQL